VYVCVSNGAKKDMFFFQINFNGYLQLYNLIRLFI